MRIHLPCLSELGEIPHRTEKPSLEVSDYRIGVRGGGNATFRTVERRYCRVRVLTAAPVATSVRQAGDGLLGGPRRLGHRLPPRTS